jgi:hypothetical protein
MGHPEIRLGCLGAAAAVAAAGGGGSGWPSRTMVTFLKHHRRQRLVVCVALHAGNGFTTSTLESSHWPKSV